MTVEPVIFLHIPRTGGMSFRRMMDITYGYQNIGRPWWGEHEGEKITKAQQQKSAWYGHFKFGLHEQIERPVKYITIVREPSARLLSEYNRNDYRERHGMTPMDLARDPVKGSNVMVRMLSGASIGDKLTHGHVNKALKNINDHFCFVGHTEQYIDIILQLRKMDWPIPGMVHENQGKPAAVSFEELFFLRSMPELELDYALYRRLTYA